MLHDLNIDIHEYFFCIICFKSWTEELKEILGNQTRQVSKCTISQGELPTGHSAGKNHNKNLQVIDSLTLVQKYHNQSNVVFGGDNEAVNEEDEKKKEEERKKKEEELNKKLPDYDPKLGGKSSVTFGDTNQPHTSVKVRAPPGGRSNFTLG